VGRARPCSSQPSMGSVEALERCELTEAQSFERMRVRLRAVANAAPPCVDPRALAMRALLVTDRLGQPDLLGKVHSLGRAGACDPRSVDDLRVAARRCSTCSRSSASLSYARPAPSRGALHRGVAVDTRGRRCPRDDRQRRRASLDRGVWSSVRGRRRRPRSCEACCGCTRSTERFSARRRSPPLRPRDAARTRWSRV
jgi:hypothetical protein